MDKIKYYYFDLLNDDIINLLFYHIEYESYKLTQLKFRYGKLYGIYRNKILSGKINPSLYFKNLNYNKETLLLLNINDIKNMYVYWNPDKTMWFPKRIKYPLLVIYKNVYGIYKCIYSENNIQHCIEDISYYKFWNKLNKTIRDYIINHIYYKYILKNEL
jgi:hypothetical protein